MRPSNVFFGVILFFIALLSVNYNFGRLPDWDKAERLNTALPTQYKTNLANKEIQVTYGGDSYVYCDGESLYMTNSTISFDYSISFDSDLSADISAPREHGKDFSMSLVMDLRNAMLGFGKVCQFNALISERLRGTPVNLPLSAGHEKESGSDGSLKWAVSVSNHGEIENVYLHVDSLNSDVDASVMAEQFMRKIISVSAQQMSAR